MNGWSWCFLIIWISSCGYRGDLVNALSPTVNWDTVWRANRSNKFAVNTELNRNVGLLRLFPGITAATVSQPGKRGDGGR